MASKTNKVHIKKDMTSVNMSKPDIKLVKALQKDFEELYVKEFTTAWKENRLIRNIELGIMRLDNTEKYIARLAKSNIKEKLNGK
tara:strand:+ start:168 stop:422 length:255 start_codon:yes stop_codon:yes gene_type:complete